MKYGLILLLSLSLFGVKTFASGGLSLMSSACEMELKDAAVVSLLDQVSLREAFRTLRKKVSAKVIGQEEMIETKILALLTNENVLIIGPSGTAKTRGAKVFAGELEGHYSYIPIHPEVLPSEILGSHRINLASGKEEFVRGPIFANYIHLDELNRATEKLQASLLEAMEAREVTVNGITFRLSDISTFTATINPASDRGTHSFVQAQGDRFLLSLKVTHASELEDEQAITAMLFQEQLAAAQRAFKGEKEEPSAALILFDMIRQARLDVLQVELPKNVSNYLHRIILGTRRHSPYFAAAIDEDLRGDGVSTRATAGLEKLVRARAWLDARTAATRDDVDALVSRVLGHRLELSDQAKAAGITANNLIQILINHAKETAQE